MDATQNFAAQDVWSRTVVARADETLKGIAQNDTLNVTGERLLEFNRHIPRLTTTAKLREGTTLLWPYEAGEDDEDDEEDDEDEGGGSDEPHPKRQRHGGPKPRDTRQRAPRTYVPCSTPDCAGHGRMERHLATPGAIAAFKCVNCRRSN